MSDLSDPAPEPRDPASNELSAADPTEQGAPPPAGYDPADYRWVPVRRRPRYDGWTEEKQRRFIEMLADTGLVSAAASCDLPNKRPLTDAPTPRPRPSRTPPWPVRTLVTLAPREAARALPCT